MPTTQLRRRSRANTRSSARLIRPLVQRLHAYVPGEQPQIRGLIKLNTNENPYPPAPGVLAAVRAAVDGRLRLYPNPTAQGLREKLARFHDCTPEQIIVGNGSDELLALATRAFVEPVAKLSSPALSQSVIQYFSPSYSLYPVLAGIQGAASIPVSLLPDFSLPTIAQLESDGAWDFNAALSFITTPNAPSGHGYSTESLAEVCRAQTGVVVLDETYADFAIENALQLALEFSHVLVARTFSKAYSLCFQRVGYMVGSPELIAALNKIRDSYNVNGLAQVAATATLEHLPYYQRNFQRIIRTRERVARELLSLGFFVCPSQSNFLLVRPPRFPARTWLNRLRDHRILVRWFPNSPVQEYLRISIGSDSEMRTLLRTCQLLLSTPRKVA